MGSTKMRDQQAISDMPAVPVDLSRPKQPSLLCGRLGEALFDNPQAYAKVWLSVWLWLVIFLPLYFLMENQPLYLGGPDSGSWYASLIPQSGEPVRQFSPGFISVTSHTMTSGDLTVKDIESISILIRVLFISEEVEFSTQGTKQAFF